MFEARLTSLSLSLKVLEPFSGVATSTNDLWQYLSCFCYCFSGLPFPFSPFPLVFHGSHRDIENVKFVCFLSLLLKVFAAAADNATSRVLCRSPSSLSNFISWPAMGTVLLLQLVDLFALKSALLFSQPVRERACVCESSWPNNIRL